MSLFFFDLAGELPARDMVGHHCRSAEEAEEHAAFIARRIALAKPGLAKPDNYIEVRDGRGAHVFSAPIQLGSLSSPNAVML